MGNGAMGGLINIHEAAGRGQTELLYGCAGECIAHPGSYAWLSGTVVQGFQGKKDWFDYNLCRQLQPPGGMFDGRAPAHARRTTVGGFADTKNYNIGEQVRGDPAITGFQPSTASSPGEDTNYLGIPTWTRCRGHLRGTCRFVVGRPAQADEPQISADYTHPNLFLDSRVHLQGYYRTQQTRFPTLDSRLFRRDGRAARL